MGRTLAASCQLEIAWSSTRDSLWRLWSSSAPTTMMNNAGSMSADWSFHVAACSTMPMPQAAAKITGKFSILPITAAASAFTRIDGPNAGPSGSPIVPARRIIVTADRNAAIIHATLWVNPTLTPSSDERSALSELARRAMPMLVKRRNENSPAMQSMVTTTPIRSLAWKMIGWMSRLKSNGCGRVWTGTIRLSARKYGIATARPASNCAIPIVTTMRIRRGAFENRRMTTRSMKDPSTTAPISMSGIATQYGQSCPLGDAATSATHRLAGTAPRSAWAKLMTRLAR